MKLIETLLFVLLLVMTASVFASPNSQDNTKAVGNKSGWVASTGIGFTCCGQTLGPEYYKDGKGYHQSLPISLSFAYNFGGTYYFYPFPMSLHMVVGQQTNDPAVVNSFFGGGTGQSNQSDPVTKNVIFDRLTLEITPTYEFTNRIRFGVGYTRHFLTTLDATDYGGGTVKFKDANGLVLEYDIRNHRTNPSNRTNNVWLTVRYVHIRYQARGFSDSVDGSHIGIYISIDSFK